MFGHRDDVITQDQKRDADVKLPDDAFALLTSPPAKGSQTDSPQPATSTPPPPKTPPLAATSVDGFSAPAANLTDPMNYSVTPAPQSPFMPSQDDNTQTDYSHHDPQVPADHPEPAMEPIELSHSENPHDDYLDNLSQDTPDDKLNELVQEAPADEAVTETEPAAIQLEEQVPEEEATSAPEPTRGDDNSDTVFSSNDTPDNTDLNELKQAALAELSPLVDKLTLEPEERFRTLMMLIQASDNQALLPQAHEAAKNIADEKTRAQALLDIVNEINYFSK